MKLIVKVNVAGDFNADVTTAFIELNEDNIKYIFKLSRQSKKNMTVAVSDYSPELGTTDVDLENGDHYRNVEDFSAMMSDTEVFSIKKDARKDCVTLNVDSTDFWWDGYFKHTDVRWETAQIPLSFLPQKLNVKPAPKNKSDLDMTAEQMNAIHEKIARGINHGLNANEIVDTFNRHITKAQLVRVIWELIERKN